MSQIEQPLARVDARGLNMTLLAARYHVAIVDGLVAGARAAWAGAGGDPERLRLEYVPGAFELPLAAQAAARSGAQDGVVALGCVIRGETTHYDLVAGECARGLQRVALAEHLPVAFGVLTTENEAQALARSVPGPANKGAEALVAAVAMARLLRSL
jgi:6,7-dimethyl-8-ribityllumazine synthase